MRRLLDMQAAHSYNACMKKRSIQYTLRIVPERTDARLREAASAYGISLNEAALTALLRGLGVEADAVEYNDLDGLIGSWIPDPACDQALEDMDKVDSELWA